MTTILPMAAIAAIAPFMAKRDVRFYLNGCFIQSAGDRVRLVATNGSVLCALAVADSTWTGPDAIIPRELVEWALKQRVGEVGIALDGDAFTITAGAVSMTANRIDGRFPDWQAVFPIGDASGEPAGFDVELVGLIAKAATDGRKRIGKRRCGPAVTLEAAGERSTRFAFEVSDQVTARGVIMPMRDSAMPVSVEGVL